MTKAELIEEVAKVATLTKKETELIVNTVFDNITEALSKGDKVELRGFGSFRIRQRNSRKGRNPKTGDSVSVPEKRVPFFKVGKRCANWSTHTPEWSAPGAVADAVRVSADPRCRPTRVFCRALRGDDRGRSSFAARAAFLILNAYPMRLAI
jgi:integration host factor subunit beta